MNHQHLRPFSLLAFILTTLGCTAETSTLATTFEVSPEEIDFGAVAVDAEATRRFTITNNSDAALRIAMAPSERDVTAFLLGPSTLSLDAEQSKDVEVRFTPRDAVAYRQRFVVRESSRPDGAHTVDVTGRGEAPTCATASTQHIDFGVVVVGDVVTEQIVITNESTDDVELAIVDELNVVECGSGPASFCRSVLAGSKIVVPASGSRTIEVTFEPHLAGVRERGSFAFGVGACRTEILVEGQVAERAPPCPGVLDVAPSALDFGLVATIAPARRSLLVRNPSFESVAITDIVADAANTGAFALVSGGPSVLEPGSAVTLVMAFEPIVEGVTQTESIIRTEASCEPIVVPMTGEGRALPPCRFALEPEAIDFGAVEPSRTAQRTAVFRNTGPAACLVTGARMSPGSDSSMALRSPDPRGLVVEPGGSATFDVAFTPPSLGEYAGALELQISNPTTPIVEVPLAGRGERSTIRVSPDRIDFGVLGVQCAASARTVTITNIGPTAATIDDVSLAPSPQGAFSLVSPTLGALAAGTSRTFDVAFAGGPAAAYAGGVRVSATVAGRRIDKAVGLLAKSEVDPIAADEFVVRSNARADILFVIQRSVSMTSRHETLGAAFPSFEQAAQSAALDYQIGVVTTAAEEDGRLVHPEQPRALFGGPPSNRIITSATQPSPAAVFATNVAVGVGGPYPAPGLDAVLRALTPPHASGPNAGFLRSDAVLAVVFVSDGDDGSLYAPDFYVNFLRSIHGFHAPNQLRVHAVVGDAPGGCNGPAGTAAAGWRYLAVAAGAEGTVTSICRLAPAAFLADLATEVAAPLPSFALSSGAVASTITVFVNGVGVPSASRGPVPNWTYDASTNRVRFASFAAPQVGDTVRIEYTPECL